jgi:hypothetical protein
MSFLLYLLSEKVGLVADRVKRPYGHFGFLNVGEGAGEMAIVFP